MNDETMNANNVKYLDWDSEFFGFSIGRIHAHACTERQLKKELENAGVQKIQFIELFCDTSDSESIYASEELAFHLSDLRFTFKKKPGDDAGHSENVEYAEYDKALTGLSFKKAGPENLDDLKIAGHGLFTNSRYYRYPRFDKNKVDSMFQLWIEKTVKGEFDDELYYLGNETGILSFNSLKFKEDTASIGLFGVNEAHRGKGFGSLLLNRVLQLLYKRRVNEVNVVTQGRNTNAVRLYQKHGFFLSKITLCYYKWLAP